MKGYLWKKFLNSCELKPKGMLLIVRFFEVMNNVKKTSYKLTCRIESSVGGYYID